MDAGQVTEVDVPLVEGGTSTVVVEVEGLVAGSEPRSGGAVVQDPRARFGQVVPGASTELAVASTARCADVPAR